MDPLRAFAELGTRFLRPPHELGRRISDIKALLFDWDGVFNDGEKDAQGGSPFSEVDSMGVNLLRFALWRQRRELPPCAIITGQHNPMAETFAQRERLHAVYAGYTHKPEAFDAFLAEHALDPRHVAFFFDDVLDLPVARRCGLRVLLRRRSSPVLENFIVARGDADLLTHYSGGLHGLREACEVLLALSGRPDEIFEQRVQHDAVYQAYLADKGAVTTRLHRHAR
jgi:3-deoxy-D-manno-octulosonate 8-phosphate phosphatase (KDO 8-P phosphatase)